MADADVVLRFEIVEGATPNAENVANALLAWINLAKIAGSILDPDSILEVGLAGVEDGSDIFKLTLRRIENAGQHLMSGAAEYPLVSKAAITLAGLIGSTMVVVSITNAMSPDPRIPDDQMAVFEHQTELLAESVELQKEQMRFYGILQDDPAFERFEVIRPHDAETLYSIPRSEFAERSGLWSAEAPEAAPPESRITPATWEVVLIRAVLVPTPRRWSFARDGIEFSALMEDHLFLQAVHNKTLPMQVAEGVQMKIEVTYKEVLENGAWLPVTGSHKVVRVLDPLPPAPTFALFTNSDAP